MTTADDSPVPDYLGRLRLDGRSYVVNQALDELEQLTGGGFFRVNRQHLVSRQAVKDATHYMHRKYVVNLSVHFKETLVVSKNRTTDFLEWLTSH